LEKGQGRPFREQEKILRNLNILARIKSVVDVSEDKDEASPRK